jgi:hypothetical protein
MKFNLLALACALMLAFGLSMGSFAGSIADGDSDGVPDVYDNCQTTANGPLAGACSAQQDGDVDGYGNACDTDFNNDGGVGLDDVNAILGASGTTDPEFDLNCDGGVGLDDVNTALGTVGTTPGPSGLACAGTGAACPPV